MSASGDPRTAPGGGYHRPSDACHHPGPCDHALTPPPSLLRPRAGIHPPTLRWRPVNDRWPGRSMARGAMEAQRLAGSPCGQATPAWMAASEVEVAMADHGDASSHCTTCGSELRPGLAFCTS